MSEISEKPVPPVVPLSPTHRPLTVCEVMAALIVLSHGFVFLSPPNTFALSINYRVMQSIAEEWVWGGAFLALFVAWLFAVILRRFRWRQVLLTTFGLIVLWMGLSFFLSNVNTTIGYTLIIIGGGTLTARLGLR